MIFTLTIDTSSHPDYDLFAQAMIRRRQIARRGSRVEIDTWVAQVAGAAAASGHSIKVVDSTL